MTTSKICQRTLSKIQKHFFNNPANPYPQHIKDINFQTLSNGTCKVTYNIKKSDCNAVKTLHGGFIATLVDNITVFAAMTKIEDLEKTSPSTANIHINYKSAGKVGTEIVVESKVTKAGRRLIFTDCQLYELENPSRVLADGSHTLQLVEDDVE